MWAKPRHSQPTSHNQKFHTMKRAPKAKRLISGCLQQWRCASSVGITEFTQINYDSLSRDKMSFLKSWKFRFRDKEIWAWAERDVGEEKRECDGWSGDGG